jgi:8-oxo-dGTP pyrophosphatase MutT (NUDIX family)
VTGGLPRVGGRVLILDPDGRVLLIHERSGGGHATRWLAPGGGIEAGETPRQAAVREVYEETGIRLELPEDAEEVCTVGRQWSWDGVTYDQVDHLFTARVPRALPVEPAALTGTEQVTVVGWRWWTVAELRAGDENFEPEYLADLVEGLGVNSRTAGRVLLIDDAGRVLLIEHHTDVGAASTHWITPGGGVEPGETPVHAAVRELREEAGIEIALADHALPVHVDRERFSFNARSYQQTNHYFLARLAAGTRLRVAGVDEVERAVLVGERWWTLAQLRATTETVYPVGLADLLESLLSATGPAPA